jgi:hypothetical protein
MMKLIEIYVLAWNKYINIAINIALLNWLLLEETGVHGENH